MFKLFEQISTGADCLRHAEHSAAGDTLGPRVECERDGGADDPRLELRASGAGTMAVIDCRALQSDAEAIRSRLLVHDVAVIS
jgi:hypothetical protein